MVFLASVRRETPSPFSYKKGTLAPNQHNTAAILNRATQCLVQYVIAQERFTQRVMGYLQSLADLNPQIAIGRSLRPGQERRIHRLVKPLPPIEEECVSVPEMFSQDPVQLPFPF